MNDTELENNGLGLESRDGKYYIKCSDGEVERTKEEMELLIDAMRENEIHLKEFIDSYDLEGKTIKDFSTMNRYFRIEKYYENLQKVLLKLIDDEPIKERGFQNINFILSILKEEIKKKSLNPYLKNHKFYEFELNHLLSIERNMKNYKQFIIGRKYCCTPSSKIFMGLLHYDINKDTYQLFYNNLNMHVITNFNHFLNKENREYLLEKQINRIQEVAELFSEPDLKNYFLESVLKDALENTNKAPFWTEERLKFEKKFVTVFQNYFEPISDETEVSKIMNRTKETILKEINGIDKNLFWEYAFRNEEDLNTFVNLLTCYFEFKDYTIPKQTIKLKRGCKTRMATILNPIYKELSNETKKLKTDIDFYKIVRVLNDFKNLTDAEIYKAITR